MVLSTGAVLLYLRRLNVSSEVKRLNVVGIVPDNSLLSAKGNETKDAMVIEAEGYK